MPNTATIKKSQPAWVIPTVIVIGGLVAGLMWSVWMAANEPIPPTNNVQVPAQTSDLDQDADAKTVALEQVGESTELDGIEQDLNATDFSGLDSEVELMGQEISQ